MARPCQVVALFETDSEEELAGIPGVTVVGAAMVPLLTGSGWGTVLSVEGQAGDPAPIRTRRSDQVERGVIPAPSVVALMAGRNSTNADTATSPKVRIVR